MKEKEFTGIDVPERITDPEDRELFIHLIKAQEIAVKKDLPFLAHTLLLSSKASISLAIGCPHCIAIILQVAMETDPKLVEILLKAVTGYIVDKSGAPDENSTLESLINHARKNDPAGN
ncbi:MAG: hypothetical protein LBS20_11810 [Prevotella sp.]|jgi:hypothetical protein|nr:hypothetical protein [Prevotella sp.]